MPTLFNDLVLSSASDKAKLFAKNFSIGSQFLNTTSMPNSVESIGYIKCYSSSSPRPVKTAILSDTTIRRSAVDQEDLKSYWKSEKRSDFSRWSTIKTFRHILKSSASIYESSGSQFFRTTTGIQSGPDAFDESRFVMTFLTTMAVMEWWPSGEVRTMEQWPSV